MRTVMWSKWASNLVLLSVIFLVVLMIYWQQKLVNLEEEQKALGTRLGRITQWNHAQKADEQFNTYDATRDGVQTHDDSTVIIYNRIPKTGSTSFMGIAYELCSRNDFHVIHLNTTKNSHVLSPGDQLRFAQNVSGWLEKRPAIYHGHLSFIDFSSLGVPLRPLYINILRDPLDRLVSYYYFLRYGDNFRPEVIRKRKGNKEVTAFEFCFEFVRSDKASPPCEFGNSDYEPDTFDECVTRQGPDCDSENLWMQIPFFCGHNALCWEAGNSWALQQAKANLAKSYFIVGVTESMEEFIRVLEASLPRFFSGALKLFDSGGKSHLRQTYGKQAPSKDTVKIIRKSKIWQMEQDFYMFAKKNFNAVRKRTLSNNGSKPITQQFRFEKIRPNLASALCVNSLEFSAGSAGGSGITLAEIPERLNLFSEVKVTDLENSVQANQSRTPILRTCLSKS